MDNREESPLYGHPDTTWLSNIHYAGITSSCVSILAYISLIIFLNLASVGQLADRPLAKWSITERCFVLMSTMNAIYACCHLLDLMRILALETTGPEDTCSGFASIYHAHLFGEYLMMGASVIMAYKLYHTKRPLQFGRYQWLLVGPFLLLPLFISVMIMLIPHTMGRTGSWCFIALSTFAGQIYAKVMLGYMLSILVACSIASIVLLCLTSATRNDPRHAESTINAHNIARTLLIFVPLGIVNSFMLLLYIMWTLVETMPVHVVVAVIVFRDAAGVFYCIAYALVRPSLKPIKVDRPPVMFHITKMDEIMYRDRSGAASADSTAVKSSIHSGETHRAFTNLHFVQDIEI